VSIVIAVRTGENDYAKLDGHKEINRSMHGRIREWLIGEWLTNHSTNPSTRKKRSLRAS
jgi:hypothetical protein